MFDGVHIDTKFFDTAMADIYVRSDRSNMWALREAGRQTKRSARATVRVYGGKKPRGFIGPLQAGRHVNVTSGKRGVDGKRKYEGKTAQVIPGLLRDSINSSRRLAKIGPRTYRLSVGPRGGHVHLYAQKIEALDAYMEKAAAKVIPKFPKIQEAAMARVLAKYGPVKMFGHD